MRELQANPGTEKVIDGIDVINICTGLIPDNQLLTKGQLHLENVVPA